MRYTATQESVTKHQIPQWYQDAKFGIFIHWGLYSVPGWAWSEKGKTIMDLQGETNPFVSQKWNPYSEWYQNSLRIDGSPTQDYHKKTFGDHFLYQDFQSLFEKESARMNPESWADLFKHAGAKYVVMVTKHHDGYCLWPSRFQNPQAPGYHSSRDLVGELTDAVRKAGMKMGLYYSGIFDWTFKKKPMNSPENWLDHYLASDVYAEYSLNQTEELIQRYHPSILWNDMGYPGQCDLNQLFADYYNAVPEGVVNERWVQRNLNGRTLEEYTRELQEKGELTRLDDGIHGDYTCPEYIDITSVPEKKWESCRGIGMSFGYNRNEKPENFLTGKDVIYSLADIVSKNGNLLLNVGPCADGSIQEEQGRPLMETGKWLKLNGEAIYGTTIWEKRQEGETDKGRPVRYTKKGHNLYVMILDEHPKNEVVIRDLEIPQGVKLTVLGEKEKPQWNSSDGKLEVKLPAMKENMPAYVLKIENIFN